MAERLTIFTCAICGKPVRLEDCKVNDLGEPVHESCYAQKLNEQLQARKVKLDRSPA